MRCGPTRSECTVFGQGSTVDKKIYMDQGKLYVMEDGRETEISVRAYETDVQIGCMTVTREAFEHILRKVRNG